MRRVTSVILLTLLGTAMLVPASTQAGAQDQELGDQCVYDETTTVDVLLLMDQSRSLRIRDDDDQRVPGAKTVVTAFASLAERVSSVRIQVAGFGTEFNRSAWTDLDSGSEPAVIAEVESFRERNNDWHTDYAEALDGVVEEFGTSTASCKILYWFTDGEHDLEPGRFGDGLQRSYPVTDPVVVTDQNLDEVMALMPSVVCEVNGYADLLGEFGVVTEVRLLGSGANINAASRRVLEGMGGNPNLDCGPGNGSFESVDDADDLPYELACSSQFGLYPVRIDSPNNGMMTVTDADVDESAIPYSLAGTVRVIAVGASGEPTIAATSLEDVQTSVDKESSLLTVDATLVGDVFDLSISGADRACAFVSGESPLVQVNSVTPALYQGESGKFFVVVEGPHGRITGTDLEDLTLEASNGDIRSADDGWTIEVSSLPSSNTFGLTTTVSAGPLTNIASFDFILNESIKAPRIVSELPLPVEGEGIGPFTIPLDVDGQDGGTICVDTNPVGMVDPDGKTILEATANLGGSKCIDIEPGAGQRIELNVQMDRQADVYQILEFRTSSTQSERPDRSEQSVLALDLRLQPVVNTIVLAIIVIALLVLLLGLLWGTLYGTNRLVSRIPDARKHKVRFAEFKAEIVPDSYGGYEAELVRAPKDTDLRVPRSEPSSLKAGRLTMRRRVPLRPWVPPYADLSLDSEYVAVQIGDGAIQSAGLAQRNLKTRSRAALGPLVSVALSSTQVEGLIEGNGQSLNGVVLFDTNMVRGQDAARAVRALIDDGLSAVVVELANISQRFQIERTTET